MAAALKDIKMAIQATRVLQHQTKLMFYSGDTDGAITTFGSKSWMKNLGWDVLEAYRPWYTDGQVSGYTQLYDGLTEDEAVPQEYLDKWKPVAYERLILGGYRLYYLVDYIFSDSNAIPTHKIAEFLQ